ncbi:MAG: TadE/TadG family type IV pilus assembly protein [Acidimicrobiia bacterium]|nr:TadE/TadG family type IV pilus assembly protein [Acidimicrobiia bacterium]
MRNRERGSATVELALLVPLILVLLVVVVEVAVVARAQVELVAAAREGARVAATSPDPERAVSAVRRALGTSGVNARIAVRRPHVVGRPAEVKVTLQHEIAVPLLGVLRVPLVARAVMAVER